MKDGIRTIMDISSSIQGLLPMLAMKDGIKGKDIRDVLKQLIMIDVGTKFVPFMLGRVVNMIKNKQKPPERPDPFEDLTKKSASIQIHRLYDKNNENDTFDAIIWRLCQLPQTKHLKMASNGVYVLSTNDVVHVEEDIHVKQLTISFDEKKGVNECSIEIFSYTVDLLNLKDYIADLVHKYNIHRNNQLGQTIYYFDEIPINIPMTMSTSGNFVINYDIAPKNMSFSMSRLHTNKNLENVYGHSMEVVRKRVRFFMNNKKWYQDKGVPYTLGIMMYGLPGCGKTSLIKALSKDCQRHVFNIKLSESTTISQINNLFFSEKVMTVVDGINTSYNIPIDKRLIVIEDIDCLSNIVLERQAVAPEDTSPLKAQEPAPRTRHQDTNMWGGFDGSDAFAFYDMIKPMPSSHKNATKDAPQDVSSSHAQKLTLAYLLNVLDGVLETPGRIVIMTSNHPEKLDKALVRPGRIDLKVHFEKCTKEDVAEMISKITEVQVPIEALNELKDNVWTPAEVTQKIFENIDNGIEVIIDSLKN